MTNDVSIPQMTVEFIPLTPELQASYVAVQSTIHQLAELPHGLAFILNAIVTTGDSSFATMAMWTDVLIENGWDSRDLAGIVPTRPVDLPRFVD